MQDRFLLDVFKPIIDVSILIRIRKNFCFILSKLKLDVLVTFPLSYLDKNLISFSKNFRFIELIQLNINKTYASVSQSLKRYSIKVLLCHFYIILVRSLERNEELSCQHLHHFFSFSEVN